MNLQTFKAETMAEALSQVKSVMGHEAVILHTRTYQRRAWLGLRRREVVEIIAGRNIQQSPMSLRRPETRRPVNSARKPMTGIPTNGRSVAANSRELLQTPAAGNAVMLGISQQVAALETMVKDLVIQAKHQKNPQVPQELLEQYTQLIENQVADELAEEICKALYAQVRPEHFAQPQFIQDKLSEQLEKLLPTSGPIIRSKTTGPHVVALIGPTGVGKTTTIAKLAANLKLREKRRVGLITIDTFRIAAIDQLKKYADIIGSPLKVVSNPEDLRAAMESMSDCEFILIDTAGRSPNDTLKLQELKSFLAAANPDEIHMVVSTTASEECVELAITRFNEIGADKVIFTKIDEAAHVGVVLNVIRKVNKKLSYITTGQDVPDDIEVGKPRRLAQMILGNNG